MEKYFDINEVEQLGLQPPTGSRERWLTAPELVQELNSIANNNYVRKWGREGKLGKVWRQGNRVYFLRDNISEYKAKIMEILTNNQKEV